MFSPAGPAKQSWNLLLSPEAQAHLTWTHAHRHYQWNSPGPLKGGRTQKQRFDAVIVFSPVHAAGGTESL